MYILPSLNCYDCMATSAKQASCQYLDEQRYDYNNGVINEVLDLVIRGSPVRKIVREQYHDQRTI